MPFALILDLELDIILIVDLAFAVNPRFILGLILLVVLVLLSILAVTLVLITVV